MLLHILWYKITSVVLYCMYESDWYVYRTKCAARHSVGALMDMMLFGKHASPGVRKEHYNVE